LAQAESVPLVATNAVCFLTQADMEAHEARLCIHQGELLNDPQRKRAYTTEQYLRSPQEMQTLFADIPQALTNTLQIAQRCNLVLTFDAHFLPEFPLPSGVSVDTHFDQAAAKGLEKRLQWLADQDTPLDKAQTDVYWERLKMELEVIKSMGFPGYFLIVADFIHWAKAHGVPVGPGRGSGAGSLVAYALEITDVDPLVYDLLFERFLNPERVSMPDFDIDFCMEGRDRVIEYVMDRYGREHVAQIITYGTMAARAVVRDVGRVLAYPYGFVDKLAKLVPFEVGMTLKKALQQEDRLNQLYQDEEEVKTLIDLSLKLEGTPRNVGKHAGGVVIAPKPLTHFTPLFCEDQGEGVITQLDKMLRQLQKR
jgi:DNA polymerase-3 subunit alpha